MRRRTRLNSDAMNSIDTVLWTDLNVAQKRSVYRDIQTGDEMFSDFYDYLEDLAYDRLNWDGDDIQAEAEDQLFKLTGENTYQINTDAISPNIPVNTTETDKSSEYRPMFTIGGLFSEGIFVSSWQHFLSIYFTDKPGLHAKACAIMDVKTYENGDEVFIGASADEVLHYLYQTDRELAVLASKIIAVVQKYVTELWNLILELFAAPMNFDYVDSVLTYETVEAESADMIPTFVIMDDNTAQCIYYPHINH